MESIEGFHTFLLVIITVVALFVLALLAICNLRFNSKSNPDPSRTAHNTVLEVAWTVIPVIILVVIAIPSFRLLYFELEVPEVADGVIEIRRIAREPGYRTKIAVHSNDPRVDCVGACVGACGARSAEAGAEGAAVRAGGAAVRGAAGSDAASV